MRKNVKIKFKDKRFNSGQTGHFANKCHKNKKQPQLLHARRASSANAMKQTEWCVDGGATAHMCCSRDMFTDFVERDESISLAGDKQIVAKGDVEIENNNDLAIKFQNLFFFARTKHQFYVGKPCC